MQIMKVNVVVKKLTIILILKYNIIEKLNIILNPSTPEDIKTYLNSQVSFMQQSLELRKVS